MAAIEKSGRTKIIHLRLRSARRLGQGAGAGSGGSRGARRQGGDRELVKEQAAAGVKYAMFALSCSDRLGETLIGTLMAGRHGRDLRLRGAAFLSSVPHVQDVAIRLNITWAQRLCISCSSGMAKFAPPTACVPACMSGSTCWQPPWLPVRQVVVMIGLSRGVVHGVVGTLARSWSGNRGRRPRPDLEDMEVRCGSSTCACAWSY